MGVRELVVGRVTFNPSRMGYRSEELLAKRLKAFKVPGSGSMDNASGDIEKGDILLEAKSTVHSSFSLKLNHLIKIRNEALGTGRTPALAIVFTTGDGRPRKDGSWVLLPEYVFRELTDA